MKKGKTPIKWKSIQYCTHVCSEIFYRVLIYIYMCIYVYIYNTIYIHIIIKYVHTCVNTLNSPGSKNIFGSAPRHVNSFVTRVENVFSLEAGATSTSTLKLTRCIWKYIHTKQRQKRLYI